MMKKTVEERFLALGEYYAAGLFEECDRSLFYRKALALRRYYEHLEPPEYHGEKLYPSGVNHKCGAVVPHYFDGFRINGAALEKEDAELLQMLRTSDFCQYHSVVPPEHTVAGNMYIHSMPHYERVLAEGFDGYQRRIDTMSDEEMRLGLTHILCGVRSFRDRCVGYLRQAGAEPALVSALERVPFLPSRNIYEAVECWNFVLYMDDCDNLGSVASGLMPYWHGEDISALLENLYDNLDDNGGYSMSLGLEQNPLIVPCLRASVGKRRPMIELFVDHQTPPEVWDAALDDVLSGGGQPAFYNRASYPKHLQERFPQITDADLLKFCGGGCTEAMIAGFSNVGSLDAGINLLLILEQTIYQSLPEAASFEEFYQIYLQNVYAVIERVTSSISASQKSRARYQPLPMRTLLIDDCIEKERDYNNGGARYMWSIINFAGTINVIDSLLVLREQVFRQQKYSGAAFAERMRCGDALLLAQAKEQKQRFGVNDEEANALSGELTRAVFTRLKQYRPYLGLGFLPASIQFMAYADAGSKIGATPCGRKAGEALCDSLTAIFGKDTDGPTALLGSVCALDLQDALGIPVVNLTIQPKTDRSILKSLILSYMDMGGVQLQVTCTSREALEEAYAHPEQHQNLIVRVGGYSEYFCRLSDALQQKIIERTFY